MTDDEIRVLRAEAVDKNDAFVVWLTGVMLGASNGLPLSSWDFEKICLVHEFLVRNR